MKFFILHLLYILIFSSTLHAENIFHNWNVSLNWTIQPVSTLQPVITINGLFPGPLINSTTNDVIHVNVFNNLDEPLLFTWNGIQQRLNSWQDGVSGTNCPIQPGKNWTYEFEVKDQIGSFFYFPSINYQKAGGGYGPIRVNNRKVIAIPFDKPDDEFDLLIGDWNSFSYKDIRDGAAAMGDDVLRSHILINGKPAFGNLFGRKHESIKVESGKTYRLRISNVGTRLSFNFRIQCHTMTLVETEGSYTKQIDLDSLDVHVGQSYSVLFTADQEELSYYIVASPTLIDTSMNPTASGIALLQYTISADEVPEGPIPSGPDPLDRGFSIDQSRSIRWNMTAGAARPNPQGTFNVSNVTPNQTFILHLFRTTIDNQVRYTINNVSYSTPSTPPKLADLFLNGSGVYTLDRFPANSTLSEGVTDTFVASGMHKGWAEFVFQNDLDIMDSLHLDGYGFFVVGYGDGDWNTTSRDAYNIVDPVVRSTVQVYPGGWTAVYAYLDNPGMWNLRSQCLQNWYLGEELYVRVFDSDPNPAREIKPPSNLIQCGVVTGFTPPPETALPAPSPAPQGSIDVNAPVGSGILVTTSSAAPGALPPWAAIRKAAPFWR